MPRPTKILLHFGILILILHFSYSPISAIEQCDKYGSGQLYSGPQFALPAKNAEGLLADDTCDVYDESLDVPLFNDFVDRAHVLCVDDPQLIAKLVGDELGNVSPQGHGIASLGPSDNTNFAIDPKILDSDALAGGKVNEQIYGLKKPISMSNNLNPVDFTSECAAKGYDDLNECAKAFGVSISTPDGDKVNTLQASTPYQRLTSLKTQLKDTFIRAQEHIACKEEDAGNSIHCGNQYDIGGDTMSTSLANEIKNTLSPSPDLIEYFGLSPQARQKMLSLEDVKSSQTYYLVIRKHPKAPLSNFFPILNNIFKNQDFITTAGDGLEYTVIRGTLPALPAIAKNAEVEYRRWNQLKTGNDQVKKLSSTTGSVPGDSPREKIINKVLLLDKGCDKVISYQQLMGGNASSRPEGIASINWSFPINDLKDAINQRMYVYQAWIVGPKETELIAAFNGQDANAPIRADYPIRYANSFTENSLIGIPQPINVDPPSASSEKPPDECVTQDDGTTVCTPENDYLKFGDDNASANQKGGEFAHFQNNETKQKTYQSKNNPEYFEENCYYPQIESRATSRGIDLSAILGISKLGLNSSNSNTCPPSLTPSSSTSFAGDICDVADKYKVPCDYLKAIWLIESNRATSCSDAGPDGPMQIVDGDIPYIDPNQTLDRCKLTDAWELAARTLLWKMYGSGFNPDNPTATDGIKLSLDPNSRELRTTAQYNGTNGCQPSLVSQCRWGVGRSYCDAVVSIIQTGTFTWECDVEMCKQFRCSQEGPEVMCQGQSITRENCGN